MGCCGLEDAWEQGACTHTLAQNRGLCFAEAVMASEEPRAGLTTPASLCRLDTLPCNLCQLRGMRGPHPLSKPSSLPPSSPLSTPGNGDFRAIPVPQKPQAICVAQNTWMQTVSRESVLKAEIIMWRDDTVPVPLTLK